MTYVVNDVFLIFFIGNAGEEKQADGRCRIPGLFFFAPTATLWTIIDVPLPLGGEMGAHYSVLCIIQCTRVMQQKS